MPSEARTPDRTDCLLSELEAGFQFSISRCLTIRSHQVSFSTRLCRPEQRKHARCESLLRVSGMQIQLSLIGESVGAHVPRRLPFGSRGGPSTDNSSTIPRHRKVEVYHPTFRIEVPWTARLILWRDSAMLGCSSSGYLLDPLALRFGRNAEEKNSDGSR